MIPGGPIVHYAVYYMADMLDIYGTPMKYISLMLIISTLINAQTYRTDTYCTVCHTSRGTLLLRVVSQLSVNQYCSAWAHFKALFVLYIFNKE
jgi:hypothetical protein